MPLRDDDIRSNPLEGRGGRRFHARDAIVAVVVALTVLALVRGVGMRRSGEEMKDGPTRSVTLALSHPIGWLSDALPLAGIGRSLTGWLSPDADLAGGPGFAAGGGSAGGVPRVTPQSFPPTVVRGKPERAPRLRTLLVTGDSMSQPLDQELARRLAGRDGVSVKRDPHLGTGISKSALLDWGKLSVAQVRKDHPQAVVMFVGANEGFPMTTPGVKGQVQCCSAVWAAEYASRVRRMMATYRQAGAARVYWLTLPFPRNTRQQIVARIVNAAVPIAASAYVGDVRVIDLERIFTPGGTFRSSMPVGGEDRIVRNPDGVHLNDEGAKLAATAVLRALHRDFGG